MINKKIKKLYNSRNIWIISGLFLGLIIDIIIYCFFIYEVEIEPGPNLDISNIETPTKTILENNEAVPILSHDALNYEFFEELPLFEVQVIEKELSNDEDIIIDNYQEVSYILQVASFNNRYDSERLREDLALKGLISSIETSSINDNIYYRVLIGPNDNRDELNKIRRELLNRDISGIIRTISNK